MKLRVIDRILIALSGLVLLAVACWAALEVEGVAPSISETLALKLRVASTPVAFPVVGIFCAVLVLLGIYDVCALFRRGKGKRGFIAQRAENGEIAISVKSIEALVIKCAKKHGEIQVQSVSVDEVRDGLIIKLRTSLPSGMNIPLAVGTLQKQVKQYVTACSGVDVREVCVKVDSTERLVEESVFAVTDDAGALPVEQPEPAPVPVEATTPVEIPSHEIEATPQEEQQLLHQRLFSVPEEPSYVPEPPVMEEPDVPAEEEIEAEAESAVAEAAERDEPEWEEKTAETEETASEWEETAAENEEVASEWEQASEKVEESAAKWEEIAAAAEEHEAEWEETAAMAEESGLKWEEVAEEAEETKPLWGEQAAAAETYIPQWDSIVSDIDQEEARLEAEADEIKQEQQEIIEEGFHGTIGDLLTPEPVEESAEPEVESEAEAEDEDEFEED